MMHTEDIHLILDYISSLGIGSNLYAVLDEFSDYKLLTYYYKSNLPFLVIELGYPNYEPKYYAISRTRLYYCRDRTRLDATLQSILDRNSYTEYLELYNECLTKLKEIIEKP